MTDTKVEPKVVHATCVVERSIPNPATAVFAALSTPAKVREWMGGGKHSRADRFRLRVSRRRDPAFEVQDGTRNAHRRGRDY